MQNDYGGVFRKYLESKMEGATGRQRLPQKALNQIKVPFPKSIKEQKQIVAQLDALQSETKLAEQYFIFAEGQAMLFRNFWSSDGFRVGIIHLQ